MPLEGEYEPSPWDWVREQVEEYEASDGERANTLRDAGLPIVIITTRGARAARSASSRSCGWSTRASTPLLLRSGVLPPTRPGTATWLPIPPR